MKTSFTRIITGIIVLSFAITLQGCGQGKEKRTNLTGEWKFILGDNMKYASPKFDDSDWENIRVPSTWNREGFQHYHGYAWYRKTVDIEYKNEESLYLELGKIDDVDEVYLNGHLIGRTGGFPPEYYSAHDYSRRYLLPAEHINKNAKNVIAVRVFDEGGEGGITHGTVGIFNYANYSDNSINLFGRWKFHLFDDPKWSAETLDESDWEDVMVPATWESQGFGEYDGFAWYRKTFKLPNTFKTEDMIIILGKIDDLDEVYINGKLVGKTGNMDKKWSGDNEHNSVRTYTIGEGVLNPGKTNVIAVRVYDQGDRGGMYEGPVTILPSNEYKQFWRKYRSENFNVTIGSVSISIND